MCGTRSRVVHLLWIQLEILCTYARLIVTEHTAIVQGLYVSSSAMYHFIHPYDEQNSS